MMNKHDWGLVNQKYIAIKEEHTDLMDEMKEDLDFYRKRIYQATKDLMKNDFEPNQPTIKNAFIHYARTLIEHFKLEDIKELMSEQLYTIIEESEELSEEPKSADEITKQFLIRGEKPSIIRIEDCFNVIKTSTTTEEEPSFKAKRVNTPSINIRQDKFREKGVKKKSDNKNLQSKIKDSHIIYDTNTQEQSETKVSQENN
jgi:hypothetical protein